MSGLYIGTAGWSLRTDQAEFFPPEGPHLVRYSGVFPAVEINSSFYRYHKPATYRRWADSVPEHFRLSVKVPREITHEKRLVGIDESLLRFLEGYSELGVKGGPLLVQTPPSLRYEDSVCSSFFALLRKHFSGPVAVEPRHQSWTAASAGRLFHEYRLSRVAADPAPFEDGAIPDGDPSLQYFRLHGSPRMYYSAYSSEEKEALVHTLRERTLRPEGDVWCVFDNTAEGAAITDALDVLRSLEGRSS